MDLNARFKRVTDLFEEGEVLHLGYDEDRKPVVIWVNKLNSFEVEEARRDGIVQRGLKMRDLAQEGNPEREAFYAEVRLLSDEKLCEAWVNQRVEELYLDVVDEVEMDPEMREKVELMRRLPALLDDAEAADDDPRRQQLMDIQVEYMTALRKGQEKRHEEGLKEAKDFERPDLEASFFEKWRERQTLDLFMEERRITEIYLSARECEATRKPDDGWDHSKCDHSTRLLPDRAMVKKLPPGVVEMLVDLLETMTSSQREAGKLGRSGEFLRIVGALKRVGGSLDSLFPGRDAQRCPHELSVAITAALQVLGYFELPENEVPDENIWHHASRLEEWFEAIKQRRETGHQPIDEADDADMTGNEFARSLIGDD